MDLAALQDLGSEDQVIPTPIRTRTDHRLIDGYASHPTDRADVARHMRKSDLWLDVRDIDLDHARVRSVSIGVIGLEGAFST